MMHDAPPGVLLLLVLIVGLAVGLMGSYFIFEVNTFECAATCGTERGNIMVRDVCYCEYVNLKE